VANSIKVSIKSVLSFETEFFAVRDNLLVFRGDQARFVSENKKANLEKNT